MLKKNKSARTWRAKKGSCIDGIGPGGAISADIGREGRGKVLTGRTG